MRTASALSILLLFSALLGTRSTAQSVGELGRFEQRRPLFSQFRGQISGDFDGDGTPDLGVMQGCTLRVFDPLGKTVLWERSIDVEYGVDGDDLLCVEDDPTAGHTFELLGFLDFSTETHALVTADLGPNGIIAILIGIVSKGVAYLDEGKVVGALELADGRPAILTYVEQDNLFRLIGETAARKTASSTRASSTPTLHSGARAEARDARALTQIPHGGHLTLTLKYQSSPGLRLAYDQALMPRPDDTDVDGDGLPDVPMLTLLGGSPSGLVVLHSGTQEILWEFSFPNEHRDNILRAFHGFADVDGDGQKELIAGDNLAITPDGTVHTIAEDFVTLDLRDVDADGRADVVGLRTADSTIVVYGFAEAGTDAESLADRIHTTLFQNYPNPFRGATTIAYQVGEPGRVTLEVYDLLGRRIRTLVDAEQPSGRHEAAWDGRGAGGRSLAAGTYFYRLRVGETISSKQAVHLP